MEKRIIVLLTCFVCLLIQGCVSDATYTITPQVLKGQKKLDREGIEAVISHKKNSSVFVRLMTKTYSPNDYPAILIGITGDKEIGISPESIKAYIDGNPCHILTHDELFEDIKERHQASLDSIKQQYSARSQQLADSSIKDAKDPSVFEPNEAMKNTIGNTEQYGYKLDKKGLSQGMAEAEKEMETRKKEIERQTIEAVKNLNSTFILRKATIEPKTWYRGQIKISKISNVKKIHDIKLVISIEGEEHQFEIKTSVAK